VKLPRWKIGAMAGHHRQRGQRNGLVNRAEGLAQAEQAPQARDLGQVRGFSLPGGGLEDGASGDAKIR
jgi:hypothetical protein